MNDTVKIEKGIPIPPMHPRRGGPKGDVLRKMKVGDSILVESLHATGWRAAAKLAGVHVTQRTIGRQVRIWRVADPAFRV